MKQTAIDWLVEQVNSDCLNSTFIRPELIQQAKELQEQEMLDFGSKVTERWGLTKVEPHYIKDEFDKQYKSK